MDLGGRAGETASAQALTRECVWNPDEAGLPGAAKRGDGMSSEQDRGWVR